MDSQGQRRRRLVAAAGLAAALFAASGAGGQSSETPPDDLVLGTWILDREASRYDPGPPPQRQQRVYEKHPKGVKATITTVDAEGRTFVAEYVADYDSLEYPLTGSRRVDAIALRRVSPYVAEATLRHASKVIGVARRVVSEDGTTMTITYHGTAPDGRQVHNVAVYRKKKERDREKDGS